MKRNIFRDQNGIAHLMIIVIVAVVAVIGISGTLVYRHQKTASDNRATQAAAEKAAAQKLQSSAKPESTASPEAQSAPAATETAPATTPKSNPVQPTTTPAPAQTETVKHAVTFSADNCSFTAYGTAGERIDAATFTTGKGAVYHYAMPPSGSSAHYTGGEQGMQTRVQILDQYGTVLYELTSGPITAASCQAAG